MENMKIATHELGETMSRVSASFAACTKAAAESSDKARGSPDGTFGVLNPNVGSFCMFHRRRMPVPPWQPVAASTARARPARRRRREARGEVGVGMGTSSGRGEDVP